jgi:UDP-glucose 4-epimerase
VLNVACGTRISLNEVLAMLEALVDRPLRPKYRAARLGDVEGSWVDIAAGAEAL